MAVKQYRATHYQGKEMLKHRIQPVEHVTPEFLSSEWIAHNQAMREKRGLLSGKPPVIGSAYQPRIVPTPSVYIPTREARAPWRVVIRDAFALVGAVAVLGFFMFAGAAVGL